ncbi:hypothetical protein K402DRAFT_400786 [Aulographum hederae CBS 113979]|uniref:Uncharacterized protein n=1 Tax=Aulographum hederae CBS 113979 TaxID=1176131 RepID=A0A6G1HC46_9PEZI|nr:hypothetical protein K402DRAFT_400786 [Aulographum hederae CBS 113979]
MASLLRSTSQIRPLVSQNTFRITYIQTARLTAPSQSKKATAAAAVASDNEPLNQAFFPDEPAGPTVKTSIPGPKSVEAIRRLNNVFDTRSLNMMANYQNSYGN